MEPVVLLTLGTTCGRCHNWVGIPGRPPWYVIPRGSAGFAKNTRSPALDRRLVGILQQIDCVEYNAFIQIEKTYSDFCLASLPAAASSSSLAFAKLNCIAHKSLLKIPHPAFVLIKRSSIES